MSKKEEKKQSAIADVIGRLLCKIGFHQYVCKVQDCIDEFGFIPSDWRMPKVAKCSRCGSTYR